MPTITAVNTTSGPPADVYLPDLGVNIPASGQVVLTDLFESTRIDADSEVTAAVASGQIELIRTGNLSVVDGTLTPENPTGTVQGAIDYIESITGANAPSFSNPYTVLIASGVYDENLVIRKDGINLSCTGYAKISPTTGIPLIVTNATAASLATFLAFGLSHASFEANYGTLIADPLSIPRLCQIRNIELTGDGVYSSLVLGVGAGTTMGDKGIKFLRCTMLTEGVPTGSEAAIWARGVNKLTVANTAGNQNGAIFCFNVSEPRTEDLTGGFLWFSYDTALDEPSGGPQTGKILHCRLGPTAISKTQVVDIVSTALGSYTGQDTSVANLSHVLMGDTILDAGTSMVGRECSAADVTIAAGAGTVDWYGGSVSGVITDPDGKLELPTSLIIDQAEFIASQVLV